ncbi:M64 family metallopeptidase [Undibacterium sp. Ji22W]|uniref:M64 family metallopeptidase n=1 Tax=Undibacterium sp. Ji22W TaxID=3413038 RepID=UPI003BF293C3
MHYLKLILAISLLCLSQRNVAQVATAPAIPATVRVDILHSGNAKIEHYALERVVIEPLPWPGHLKKNVDSSNRGNQLFEVRDKATGELLYSRGYSTVFAEWQSTAEAGKIDRGFEESLRFPKPQHAVNLRVLKRDQQMQFQTVWSIDVDTDAPDVVKRHQATPLKPIPIHISGNSADKVDLLIIGDGYTAKELKKFTADAKRMSQYLFTVSPFKERATDFNIWGLVAPTKESGISRPSSGQFHASHTGTSYDIFGSERYVLTLDNRALREFAQNAPYEFIEILVNNKTYGGGGIFGQFSTAAAGNDWANYLFVHEFGHHFAGLADEYYTSPVAYQTGAEITQEPWEPNVTALKDPASLKWKQHSTANIGLPTSWPKERYEEASRAYQKVRADLRKNNRPESEMSALFKKDLIESSQLFSKDPNYHSIGAFEGANYEAKGYYRSQMQCLMFDRSEKFCQVCQDGITKIINLYSK